MEQQLATRWQKEIKKARAFSGITKFRIFLTFAVIPVRLLVGIQDSFQTGLGALSFFLDLAAIIAALAVFRRGLMKYDNIASWPNLKKPSPETTSEIDDILLPLTKAMEIDRTNLEVFIDYKSFGSGPSVIESRNKNEAYVLIPLGYLKLLARDRDAARAIMAHELSHLCQRDTRLWLLVTAFGRSVLKVLLPYNAVLFAAFGCFMLYMLSNVEPGTELPLQVKSGFVQLFAGIVLPVAFYYSVTKMRRKSEAIADLGAAAFAGTENVKKALAPYLKDDSDPPVSAFALHPSARQRFDALTKLDSASV